MQTQEQKDIAALTFAIGTFALGHDHVRKAYEHLKENTLRTTGLRNLMLSHVVRGDEVLRALKDELADRASAMQEAS